MWLNKIRNYWSSKHSTVSDPRLPTKGYLKLDFDKELPKLNFDYKLNMGFTSYLNTY